MHLAITNLGNHKPLQSQTFAITNLGNHNLKLTIFANTQRGNDLQKAKRSKTPKAKLSEGQTVRRPKTPKGQTPKGHIETKEAC